MESGFHFGNDISRFYPTKVNKHFQGAKAKKKMI